MLSGGLKRLWPSSPVARTLQATAVLTLAARGLGLIAQRVMVGELGASAALDGFFIALVLPGLVITPVLGAVELALSPVIARRARTNPAGVKAVLYRWLAFTCAGGVIVSALAWWAREPLIAVVAPGAGLGQRAAAETAAAVIFPAMAMQLVSGVARAVVFGSGHFLAPVAIGAVNPLATIVALLLAGDVDVSVVAWASALGSACELLLTVPLAIRAAVTCGPDTEINERVRADRVQGLGFVLASQALGRAVFFIDQAFASGLAAGEFTRFSVALRLHEAFLAVIVIANARMAPVRFASSAGGPSLAQLHVEFRRALRVGRLSALGFALAGPVVVLVVLRNGDFGTSDALSTIAIVLAFAVIHVPVSMAHVAIRLLVVVGASRATIPIAVAEAVLNLALNLVLVHLLGAVGIVLATGVTYAALLLLEKRLISLAIAQGPRSTT